MAKSKTRKTARKFKPTPDLPKSAVLRDRLRRYASEIDLSAGRSKPRLLSLLFCDFSNQTDDGKANLVGIFDRIYVHPELKISPRFIVYARMAETFQDNLWVRVFDPDNEPQIEIKFDPPSPDSWDKNRDPDTPVQIQFLLPIQMKFHKEGTYWFDIAYRDFSLGGAGLVVKFRKLGEEENATDTFE